MNPMPAKPSKGVGLTPNFIKPRSNTHELRCPEHCRAVSIGENAGKESVAGQVVATVCPSCGGGKIAIVEEEAELVRSIFRRYLELGSVNELLRDLRKRNIK